MSLKKSKELLFVILSIGLFQPIYTDAQQSEKGASRLEEVIVTAQKREQSLQDVPMAVTALGRQMLEDNEINNIEELSNLVPSLRFTESFTASNTSVRVRGVGTEVQEATVESNVSVVVDGVPLARTELLNFEFADTERIEVLRGPQGTLFGKNSTAGVVQVITRDPAPQFEGFVRFNYEENEDWPGSQHKTQIGVSGPLTDTLGARLSGYYKRTEGHLIDVLQNTNPPDGESRGLRGKLRWDPLESLAVKLTLEHQRDDAEAMPFLYRSANPDKAAREEEDIEFGEENRTTKTFGADQNDKDNDAVYLNVDWTVGPVTISSVTGWRDFLFARNQSAPGMLGDRLDLIKSPSTRDFTTFTQEFRLTSADNGPLKYTAGVHWFDNNMVEERFQVADDIPPNLIVGGATGLPFPVTPVLPGNPDALYIETQFHSDVDTRNLGVFGQATWDFAPRWHLTVGSRYIREKQSADGKKRETIFHSTTREVLIDQTQGPASGSIRDEDVTGMLSLQYDWGEHTTLYGTVARGYKGGAIEMDANTASFEEALENPVDPETVVNVEFGSKSRLFDNRLEVNVAVFNSVFKNFQARVLLPQGSSRNALITIPGSTFLTNAGELETRGIEIDFRARPLESLSFTGGFLYNEAEFTEFDHNECFPGQQPGESGGRDVDGDGSCDIQDSAGKPLPNAPKLSASLIARYETPLPGDASRVYAQLSGNWQDDIQYSVTQHPLTFQEAYSIWNLRLGWKGFGERMEIAGYVKNLFDQFYVAGFIPFSFDDDRRDLIHFVPRGANRQFGMTVAYSW